MTTHLHVLLTLKISGAKLLLPLNVFVAWTKTTLLILLNKTRFVVVKTV